MKANVCGNSTFQINRTKKRLQENDALNAMSEHVSCGERHERPFSLCLAGNRKYTKLNFSSEVRKQFQVLMVQFKQLSCCLRNDKLRTAMMFENSAKMTLRMYSANFSRMIFLSFFCRDLGSVKSQPHSP